MHDEQTYKQFLNWQFGVVSLCALILVGGSYWFLSRSNQNGDVSEESFYASTTPTSVATNLETYPVVWSKRNICINTLGGMETKSLFLPGFISSTLPRQCLDLVSQYAPGGPGYCFSKDKKGYCTGIVTIDEQYALSMDNDSISIARRKENDSYILDAFTQIEISKGLFPQLPDRLSTSTSIVAYARILSVPPWTDRPIKYIDLANGEELFSSPCPYGTTSEVSPNGQFIALSCEGTGHVTGAFLYTLGRSLQKVPLPQGLWYFSLIKVTDNQELYFAADQATTSDRSGTVIPVYKLNADGTQLERTEQKFETGF